MASGQPDEVLDQDTPEDCFAELVDRIRREPSYKNLLVDMLPERVPLYRGRSSNTTIRMRGYLLSAFVEIGLPAAAMPYVLEELQSGRDAYLVAAAARAVRGMGKPGGDVLPFLSAAIQNIKYVDDAVSFESYRPTWPLANHTTALGEIVDTFAWLGREALPALPVLEDLLDDHGVLAPGTRAKLEGVVRSLKETGSGSVPVPPRACCSHRSDERVAQIQPVLKKASDAVDHTGIELEDQDGRTLKFGEFFVGKPTVVVFFYTRCDNPNKCSLTITKLGRLQHRLLDLGLDGNIQTAAISYDPAFDLPQRLRAYGENRDAVFTESNRFLRTKGELAALQDFFELGVNFGGALVNRHRIELYVLDGKGRIVSSFTRLQWDVEEVLNTAHSLLDGRPRVGAPGAGRREDPRGKDQLGPQA